MMETRETLEWHFKQLDHSMGLSFKTNFNFAMVGHLLKGAFTTSISLWLDIRLKVYSQLQFRHGRISA